MTTIHKLIYRPRAVKTACGIRIVAAYPMSNRALPAGRNMVIGATTCDQDVEGCQVCKAVAGHPVALTENEIAALAGGRKAVKRVRKMQS
jgi:hypothetical protein